MRMVVGKNTYCSEYYFENITLNVMNYRLSATIIKKFSRKGISSKGNNRTVLYMHD
jgi:hypothetical protein